MLVDDAAKIGLKSPLDPKKIEIMIGALQKASEMEDWEIMVYISAGIGDQGIYICVGLML